MFITKVGIVQCNITKKSSTAGESAAVAGDAAAVSETTAG